MAKGMAKGEQKKQWEIALKMQEMGLPIETICQATGLSEAEVEKGKKA